MNDKEYFEKRVRAEVGRRLDRRRELLETAGRIHRAGETDQSIIQMAENLIAAVDGHLNPSHQWRSFHYNRQRMVAEVVCEHCEKRIQVPIHLNLGDDYASSVFTGLPDSISGAQFQRITDDPAAQAELAECCPGKPA